MSYKTLQNKYQKALHEIVSSLHIKTKLNSKAKVPFLLEQATLHNLRPSPRWIISAISGSGKTTISRLLDSSGFKKVPNVTTRPKRPEEKDSEYVFVSNSRFNLLKRQNLLFHPHRRNSVWHAILKNDIKKITGENSFIYLDKSVSSTITLIKHLPTSVNFNFIYILTPTFKDLYLRIIKRETQTKKNGNHLSKQEIFKRFEEEIGDMKKSIKLPYIYVVNDSVDRVQDLLKKIIKNK